MAIDLEAIKARAAAATPGPWTYSCMYGVATIESGDDAIAHAVEYLKRNDAEFMAHARDDVPALVSEVERLRQENDGLRAPCGHTLARQFLLETETDND